jgi:NADPH-dependent 2,4-dienoyl-CoA reductase/sulfur reductase-like enzyme
MGNEVATENKPKPVKVLVAGGCYAGLAAALTILERCDSATPRIPVSITIVDEKDGYCVLSTWGSCNRALG